MKHLKTIAIAATMAFACVALTEGSEAQSPSVGIDSANKVVTVGGFTPITGPVPFYAILTHAAEAYFKNRNENGGIRGWKVNYVTFDDGYEPARSVAVTKRLVEDTKIFALSAAVGTATNVAVIPYAKEVGLSMIGPIGGASAFFAEPNIFPLLPDYGWSAASNAEYALNDLKLKKIALLWENDELGRSAKRGFDLYMADRKIEPVEFDPLRGEDHGFHAAHPPPCQLRSRRRHPVRLERQPRRRAESRRQAGREGDLVRALLHRRSIDGQARRRTAEWGLLLVVATAGLGRRCAGEGLS